MQTLFCIVGQSNYKYSEVYGNQCIHSNLILVDKNLKKTLLSILIKHYNNDCVPKLRTKNVNIKKDQYYSCVIQM